MKTSFGKSAHFEMLKLSYYLFLTADLQTYSLTTEILLFFLVINNDHVVISCFRHLLILWKDHINRGLYFTYASICSKVKNSLRMFTQTSFACL